jgi:DNA ligase-1
LAIYNPANDEYESCCKIGTGFSDEELHEICENLKPCVIETAKPYYKYDNAHVPDVWFETDQVWEVKCADLTLSPKHIAGIGIIEDDKGIALRFPRFVRFRPDKKPEDATTSDQIAEMYTNQVNKTI